MEEDLVLVGLMRVNHQKLRMPMTTNPVGKLRVPRFYEMKDERHAEAFSKGVSLAEEIPLPMGERVRKEQQRASKHDVKLGGKESQEISFNPRSSKKYVEDNKDKEKRRGKRRIQSLNL
ncbi:Hypothetical predicted protein [Olea europaea subsp. europaea]|uniref:Uncharacterized protein n=1 Tax=Olea europaea subsp. europaea TaxID=158383 RepID=A0A8S0UJF3_OLEEU|nr:Hypothetical predicted protein [Olea europaea subsp. europaea]